MWVMLQVLSQPSPPRLAGNVFVVSPDFFGVFGDKVCCVGNMLATCHLPCCQHAQFSCQLGYQNDTTFDDMLPTLWHKINVG
jgi:hypothetical protein